MHDLSGLASLKGLLEHASPVLIANLFGETGLRSSEKHMKSSSWNIKFLVQSDMETFGSVFRLRESLRNVLKCKAFQVSSIIGFGSAVENHVWLLSLQLMLEGKTMALFYKKLPDIYLIVVFAMKRLCVLSFIWRRDFSETVSEGSGEDFLFGCD